MLEAFLRHDAQVDRWLGQSADDVRARDWPARFLAQSPGLWQRALLSQTALAAVEGAGEATRANARKLANDQVSIIVAGQQPAVGGGPLLILVKTAQTIALARELSTPRHPIVPMFWCASEDHDVGEANHADIVCRSGEIRRFTSSLGNDNRRSLRFRAARAWWQPWFDHCRRHLGDGPGMRWIEETRPIGDEGMGAWLCRLLHRFFADDGLIAIEGHAFRPLWTDAMARMLEHWPREALQRRREEILAAGYDDAFGALPTPPLFADVAEGRAPLNPEQARELLRARPNDLSPGAAARPALQQAALPAAVYVAGPNELQYHAFLGPTYACARVPRPLLAPRQSATLVFPWVLEGLGRWGLSSDMITASTPEPAAADSSEASRFIEEMQRRIDELERGGAALTREARMRLLAAVTRLKRQHRRLSESIARNGRRAARRPAFGTLKAQLFPRGQPQDRVMSLGQAIWHSGPGLARILVESASSASIAAPRNLVVQ